MLSKNASARLAPHTKPRTGRSQVLKGESLFKRESILRIFKYDEHSEEQPWM